MRVLLSVRLFSYLTSASLTVVAGKGAVDAEVAEEAEVEILGYHPGRGS